jgi:hypothetical protein
VHHLRERRVSVEQLRQLPLQWLHPDVLHLMRG